MFWFLNWINRKKKAHSLQIESREYKKMQIFWQSMKTEEAKIIMHFDDWFFCFTRCMCRICIKITIKTNTTIEMYVRIEVWVISYASSKSLLAFCSFRSSHSFFFVLVLFQSTYCTVLWCCQFRPGNSLQCTCTNRNHLGRPILCATSYPFYKCFRSVSIQNFHLNKRENGKWRNRNDNEKEH